MSSLGQREQQRKKRDRSPGKAGPGLRERQRSKRRDTMLRSAAAIFEEKGFEQARLEDIAEHAEVSIGTIYNYFSSKFDLLVAMHREDRERVLKQSEAIINNPPADPIVAISRLIQCDLECGIDYAGPAVWREILAPAYAPERYRKTFAEIYDRYTARMVQLLELLKRRGQLGPNVDCQMAARIFLGLDHLHFYEIMTWKDSSKRALHRLIEKEVAMIYAGLKPPAKA
ncbi:MAG: TetR/AcrR family transcriptional regulator [Parvibaculaceae bacterium]